MASTNSTEKDLNHYTCDDQGNLYTVDCKVVNTGNMQPKEKFGLIYNKTYSLEVSAQEINCALIDYNESIEKNGDRIDSSLAADKLYCIYGQPDKWIVEYDQKYNNCGVESALSILSMAGKKDIVQITKAYREYLNTDIETTVKDYGPEDISGGKLVPRDKETVTTVTRPKEPKETEDLFLLDNILKSDNDTLWYEHYQYYDRENKFYVPITIVDTKGSETVIDDLMTKDQFYVLHSKNVDYYKSIADLTKEDGTTYALQQKNILDANDVKTDIVNLQIRELYKLDIATSAITTTSTPIVEKNYNADGSVETITTERKTVDNNATKTVTTTITKELSFEKKFTVVENGAASEKTEKVVISCDIYTEEVSTNYNTGEVTTKINGTLTKTFFDDHVITVDEIKSFDRYDELVDKMNVQEPDVYTDTEDKTVPLNTEKYTFVNYFVKLINEGRGVILAGAAECLRDDTLEDKEVNHAITLLGYVTGDNENDRNDVVGFYVRDTGRWIDQSSESAQFITVQKLYAFLTGGKYAKERTTDSLFADAKCASSLNVTQDNIRIWADNLDLVGTNRKNVLYGNDGNNIIKAGDGNDVLFGGAGDDKLYGEKDHDTLYGGSGNDTLYGGAGNDTYVFTSSDINSNDIIDDTSGSNNIQFDLNSDHNILETVYDVDNSLVVSKYYVGTFNPSRFVYQKENNNLVLSYIDAIIEYNVQKDADGRMLYIGEDTAGSVIVAYKNSKGQYCYKNSVGDEVIADSNINFSLLYEKGAESSMANSVTILNYFKNTVYKAYNLLIFSNSYQITSKVNFYNTVCNNIEFTYNLAAKAPNKVTGSKYKDVIIGGSGNDYINGAAGNDKLDGGAGNDTIKGGAGNDTIYASLGNDKIYGEAGENEIIYTGTYGGNDTIYSGKGSDVIKLTNVDKDDVIYVRSNKDLIINYDKTTGDAITIANYFGAKGKVSIKEIQCKDNKKIYIKNNLDEILSKVVIGQKITSSGNIVGTDGNDTLKGGIGNDTLVGGNGDDIIYGGKGDDTLVGGLGNDKLYGEAGNNTYRYDTLVFGDDTIYTSGAGRTTIDFSSVSSFTAHVKTDAVPVGNNYHCIKSGNDLLITDIVNSHDSSIRISKFFTTKNQEYILKTKDGDINLKEQTILLEGYADKKNKLTGSAINDYIVGANLNDTIKGGAGNDTITGGAGNDTITGGSGTNTVIYNKGDGNDTINLTKGENLILKLQGYSTEDISNLSYSVVKNDLVITGTDTKITIKNFGKKDVTTASGSVNLYVNGTFVYDLRNHIFLPEYTAFTTKKKSYTGTWHSEIIDARELNKDSIYISNRKGVSINGGAGHDVIYGTKYNDTLKGGAGDDIIYAGAGKNTVDGGAGNDVYHLFTEDPLKYGLENSTIKDTGKADSDTAIFHTEDKSNLKVWFNVNKNGKLTTAISIEDNLGNKASLTGVEKIVAHTEDKDFTYNFDAVKSEVVAWLSTYGYKDVNTAIKNSAGDKQDELIAIFTDDKFWT